MDFAPKLYIVYLHGVPIGVYKYPVMAFNEANERTIAGAKAEVVIYAKDDFEEEDPTEPRCTPCAHGDSCDDLWKPGPI